MNTLKPEKKLAVLAALVEGNSIRSTERMTGVHRDTILRLLVEVGERCLTILEARAQGFHCRLIQADEIWTFCWKKEQRIKPDEPYNPEIGDQYVFVALDPDSKFIPTFQVGKRDTENAHKFTGALRTCLNGNGRIQLTTDGFRAYLTAVEEAFGSEVDYAQLVKTYGAEPAGDGRYAPPHVTEVTPTVINGNPDPARICTSHVERQNLTMRMMMRRFTRLTNAFSKKLANLKAALALHFAYYNFCRVHATLRVTPAMAAGVADHVWGLEELLA
jgi:IS1 family transposase